MPNGEGGRGAEGRMESCDLAIFSCVFYIIIWFIKEVFQWTAIELLVTYKITGWQEYRVSK